MIQSCYDWGSEAANKPSPRLLFKAGFKNTGYFSES